MKTSQRAVGFDQHLPLSDQASFQDLKVNLPTIKSHDLLVKVEGVSVNSVDTFVRRGGNRNRLKHPKIIGWDAVGTVAAVGSQTSLFETGDRVWYAGEFTRSGSNVEYQRVDERIVGHAPVNLNTTQAAGIPLVGLTAYESLFEQLPLQLAQHASQQKETILIINGGGGVGSMAIQLAKLAGLTVIATASRPQSINWVTQLGADYVVNHHHDLVQQIQDLGFNTVDFVMNLNNLDGHWNEIANIIKPAGHVVATTENKRGIDLQKLTKKRVTFAWEWMYSKAYYQTADMISQHHILDHLAQLYDKGQLKPIVTKSYHPINAANMRSAHRDVESGHMIGKVTLTGWQAD